MKNEIKQRLNEVFSNLEQITQDKHVTRLHTEVTIPLDEDNPSQGSYGESFEIFLIEDLGLHVKIVTRTCSYNEHEMIHSIQFVEPKVIEQTVYSTTFE